MNSFLVAKYWLNTSSVHCFYFWIESSYPHNKSKIRNTLNIWCCFPVSCTIFFQFIFIRMYTTDDLFFIFLSGFSFTDTDDSQDSRERDETIFYYTIPLTPTHKHSDIYLHFCMWDDYHMFLIASLVITRLLLDDIYPFIELPFDWLMMWHWVFVCLRDDLILAIFVTAILDRKPADSNSHRLSPLYYKRTKCANHWWSQGIQ